GRGFAEEAGGCYPRDYGRDRQTWYRDRLRAVPDRGSDWPAGARLGNAVDPVGTTRSRAQGRAAASWGDGRAAADRGRGSIAGCEADRARSRRRTNQEGDRRLA